MPPPCRNRAATDPPLETKRPGDSEIGGQSGNRARTAQLCLNHTPIARRAASLQPINARGGHPVPVVHTSQVFTVPPAQPLPRSTRGNHPYV
jgi:hypothetical protein